MNVLKNISLYNMQCVGVDFCESSQFAFGKFRENFFDSVF